MRSLYSLASVLVLGSGLALAQTAPQDQQQSPQGQMPPSQQQPSTSDQSKMPSASTANVQSDIQSALQKDPTLASSNVNVQVSDKDIELTGSVPTRDAKNAAEQIATSHSGGLPVKNHIKVSESPK
jgi:osmotically-inducible protein OsmY